MSDLTIDAILEDVTADRTPAEDARIDAMVKRFPLPPHMQERFLNRSQVADLYQKDEKQIDRWLRDGLPVVEKGSNGKPYKFRLSECWAWLKNKAAEELREQEEAAAAIAQASLELLGGSIGSDSEMGLTTKQRREVYELDNLYRQMAVGRGELIPRAEVDELFSKVFDIVRKSVNGMPDRLARDAGLSGRQAEQAVSIADDILTELHRTLTDFADQHDAEDTALIAAE